jgi:hypothetical protein
MTESTSAGTTSRRTPLAALGGGLSIGACCIGLLILFACCAGFNAALMLSVLPVIFGAIGFVLTIVGGVTQKGTRMEDTQILAAIFISVMAILGGLLEMSAWLNWSMLPHG